MASAWPLTVKAARALLGSSGVGKSTLVKLFAGRLDPLDGEVTRSRKLHQLRQNPRRTFAEQLTRQQDQARHGAGRRFLLDVLRRFAGSRVRIVALSIHDSTECSFVRFLLSHPEQGREIFERAGLALIETDLIGVELPDIPQPLLQVCTALLQAEVNIVQAYPLFIRPHDKPAVALMVDNLQMGQETLRDKGFRMITESDLEEDVRVELEQSTKSPRRNRWNGSRKSMMEPSITDYLNH